MESGFEARQSLIPCSMLGGSEFKETEINIFKVIF